MPRSMSISAPKEERGVEFERTFGGETLEEKVAAYGDKVVADIFDQMAVVKCASVVRSALKARNEAGEFKYTDQQAIDMGLAYVPVVGAERKAKDMYAGILAKISEGTMTKKDVVKELEDRIAALKAQEG
jgi:hypothetical protein